MRPRRRLELAWIALLVLGVGVMVPFQATVTLALGVVLLLSFVALGVYLIADPGWLAEEEDDDSGG